MKRLLLLLLLATPAFAQRSLSWDSMVVRARLDSAGALHVSEELAYVFNGDWNGGERIVRVAKGQRFTFVSLSRRDETTGALKPLNYGPIDEVDGFTTADESTVRWRSRLPSDPPFRQTRITYVLEYTLSNILTERAGRYYLDHDFAFPNRPGVIRRLTVDLELDPVWHSDSLLRRYEAGPLTPGEGFEVEGKLAFRGNGPLPEAKHDPLFERAGVAAGLIALSFLLWQGLVRREEKLGRFEPLNLSEVTPRWINEHLVPIPAEVAGAAWDEAVEAHEVSALLARWVAEGKVKSDPGGELSLELLVPRESFDGYERALIDKLFIDGDTTSTNKIRTHYASTGFDPAKVIRSGVRSRVYSLAQLGERAFRLGGLITIPALLAAVYLLYRAWNAESTLHAGVVIPLVLMGLLSLVAAFAAMVWRGRIDQGRAEMKVFRVMIVMVVIGALVFLAIPVLAFDVQAGVAAFVLAAVSAIVDMAKSKRGRSAIAFRKRLAAARQYFTQELEKRTPALDDHWFPYVIAFGLDNAASGWATRFGGERLESSSPSSSSYSSGSSSSSSSPTWTGGGGAFGGAGATGSWAAAASGLSAGVAAPRSSSSGGGGSSSGGGGGGSSSSGGGSGGGW